jgi:hypothetical protein
MIAATNDTAAVGADESVAADGRVARAPHPVSARNDLSTHVAAIVRVNAKGVRTPVDPARGIRAEHPTGIRARRRRPCRQRRPAIFPGRDARVATLIRWLPARHPQAKRTGCGLFGGKCPGR